jgi:hypothetical protein
MTTQELAYAEIEKLITSFKNMPASQRKGMNEMQTRLGYILPLFRTLGWDTSNINEVSPEEKVSRGWVDFSFRIGNVPRYFLETKRANEDLNSPQWVKQAIDYAWTKSVTWALLSNFEGLRLRQTTQHTQACLIELLQGERTLRQQTIQAALIAALMHKPAVYPFDRPVLGNDQPAQIALKLNERFCRKYFLKQGCIVLHQLRKFHQWQHLSPPESGSPWNCTTFPLSLAIQLLMCCKSRVM